MDTFKKIAFLGAGNMVSAIVKGLSQQEAFPIQSIIVYSPSGVSAQALSTATGCTFAGSLEELLSDVDVLILGCKPQHLSELPPETNLRSPSKLVISLLAGKTLGSLREAFPAARSVIRAMPNTPAQVGLGVTSCACEAEISDQDWRICESLLTAIGSVHRVDESQMDSLTALGGSGPAFIFEFCRSLEVAATAQGVPTELASQIAKEMILGAATLLRKSENTSEELRNAVTSPNGTTAAGLDQLKKHHLPKIVQEVLDASAARSKELSA